MKKYQDKVVVVCGGSKGIGFGVAKEFARQGAKIAISGLEDKVLEKGVEELESLGAEVLSYVFDVSNYEEMQKFADMVYEKYGKVDYMLSNAGVTSIGNIWKIPLSDWYRTFSVNTMGIVHAIKAFIPRMIEQDSECFFIPTVSNSALSYTRFTPAYIASKHAALAVTEALAQQMEAYHTKVKVICHSPGAVDTEIPRPTSKHLDRSDPYYSTDEFIRLNTAIAAAIAAGMSVDEHVKGFFEQLDEGNFYIRPSLDEEVNIAYRCRSILTKKGPMEPKTDADVNEKYKNIVSGALK